MRRILLLAGVLVLGPGAGLPSSAAGGDGTACPAEGVDRFGRPAMEMLEAAAATAGSPEPACRALGRAVADLVLARGEAAAGAWERLAGEVPVEAGSPSLRAVAAALAFRAGRPREAHRLAVSVLRERQDSALAWEVLGRVLAARFLEEPAREAFRRALAIDPGEPAALRGLALLADDRKEKTRLLERYVAVAGDRGEPWDRVRAAREHLALLAALGDRPVFVLERADLPGTIGLLPLPGRPGAPRGFVLEAELGGRRPEPLLFDTGASGVHLARGAARRAGFQPLASGTLVGGGGDARHAVRRGIVPVLGLGPIVYRDPLVSVSSGSLERRGAYRGILGADVLGGVRFLFRPRRPVVELIAAEEAAGKDPLAVDPWDVPAGELPVLRVEGQILVPLRFGVGRDRRDGWFVLDTGASRTILAEGSAAGLPGGRAGSGARRIRAYGGTLAPVGRVPVVWIGAPDAARPRALLAGIELRDLPVIDPGPRAWLSGTRIAGWLGLDVLARAPFELDLGRGTFRFPEPRRTRRRR